MSGLPTLPAGYALAPAGLRDIASIHRLERATFPRDSYDHFTLIGLLLWPPNVNLKALDPTGQLVGHVTGSPRPLQRRAWIVTLAVAPTHQHQGIGRVLLHACERLLRPPNVRLTVRVGNTPAIALYTQSGYQRVRRVPRYYDGGEDGYVMEKRRAG